MKKTVIVILILISLFLLFPIRGQIKDGGSVEYRAVLYTVYDVHALYETDSQAKYVEGVIVEILGRQVYNSTSPHIESISDQPNVNQ